MEEVNVTNVTEIINGSDNPLVATLMTVFVVFVVVLGSTGNVLTILAILRVKKLQKPTNVLMASLALTDFFTIVLGVPILLSRFNSPEFHKNNRRFCEVSYYVMVLFCCTSVNMLQVIAVNRYFIITKPRHVYMKYWGRFGTGLSICFIWFYSFGLVCLPFFGFGDVEYIPELGGCGVVETTRLSWWYKTLLLLTVVESCGIVTPVSFLLTFKKIRDSKRRLHSLQSTQQSAVASVKPKGVSKEETAVTKMMLVIFSVTLLCWSPYLILHAATIGLAKPGGAATFFLIFAYSNSMFNPFIYAGMNKHFRNAFILRALCHPQKMPNTTNASRITSVT